MLRGLQRCVKLASRYGGNIRAPRAPPNIIPEPHEALVITTRSPRCGFTKPSSLPHEAFLVPSRSPRHCHTEPLSWPHGAWGAQGIYVRWCARSAYICLSPSVSLSPSLSLSLSPSLSLRLRLRPSFYLFSLCVPKGASGIQELPKHSSFHNHAGSHFLFHKE